MNRPHTMLCPRPIDPRWALLPPEEVPAALVSGMAVYYYSNTWFDGVAVLLAPGSRAFHKHMEEGGNALPCRYWVPVEEVA